MSTISENPLYEHLSLKSVTHLRLILSTLNTALIPKFSLKMLSALRGLSLRSDVQGVSVASYIGI